MLGEKDGEDGFIYNFRMEDHIPDDHLLRIIDRHIELDFIRDRVKHLYSHTGKPSVDPVVLIKMLLIGYFFDVKSERQLVKDIQVNIAYRWFIKYRIDEKIPDHSTISQTRRRKFSQSTLFQDLFDEVVRLCMEKGLVTGETILTDSTAIKANASLDSLREITITPSEYIVKLEENSQLESSDDSSDAGGSKGSGKRYTNGTHRSKTDPDSRILSRRGKETGLFYAEHRSIDLSGYITDVHVTAGTVHGDEPYIARLNRQRFAFGFRIRNVVADRQYGTLAIYRQLTGLGIDAYIPELNNRPSAGNAFRRNDYHHDHDNDVLFCPAGKVLKRVRTTPRKKDNAIVYRGSRSSCGSACPLHERCLIPGARWPKQVQISVYQEYADQQMSKRNSPFWKRMLRKRKTLLEGSFGDAKNNHGLRRAKYRGNVKVQEQSLLTAVVQNLKKMAYDLKKREQIHAQGLNSFLFMMVNNLGKVLFYY